MTFKLNTNQKLTFLLSGLLVGSLGNLSPAWAQTNNRCAEAMGNWAWDTRAFPVTIFSNGRVVGNDGGKIIRANWTCIDPQEGIIVVNWSTKFVDTLTISTDGMSMSGSNNKGHTTLNVIRRN